MKEENVMKYGIAIFPSKKLQDVANSFRKRYDPHYALVPPHVTLKAPFEAEDSEMDGIVKYIRKVAKETDPLKLTVYKVSTFHPVNNVIHFKIQDTDELTKLHEKLHEGKLQDEKEYNFVPHITIAQELSDAGHSDVLGSLQMKEVNHEETVDRFQLLYQLENDQWTVYETFHLGKGK
jgi:2'-5' RNA ligase